MINKTERGQRLRRSAEAVESATKREVITSGLSQGGCMKVIVGNIGTVYSGSDKAEADKQFDAYVVAHFIKLVEQGGEHVQASQAEYGRAANETVTMMVDDEIYQEYEA